MEGINIYSEEYDMLMNMGSLGRIINEMNNKQNELIEWVNVFEKNFKKRKEDRGCDIS